MDAITIAKLVFLVVSTGYLVGVWVFGAFCFFRDLYLKRGNIRIANWADPTEWLIWMAALTLLPFLLIVYQIQRRVFRHDPLDLEL